MVSSRPKRGTKYFTAAEANAMLPYVGAIVRDITTLANDLRDRHERLTRLRSAEGLDAAHREELEQVEEEFERGQERMRGYQEELGGLGVELKDFFMGLIDFPSLHEGRVVYLCWRQGEPEVGHWHELDEGFAGRRKLPPSRAAGAETDDRCAHS
jgi:hypothetical protein